MTARQLILEYLKTHRTFSSAEVARVYGRRQECINHASSQMAREGLIVVESKVWRTVYYRLTTDDDRAGRVNGNTIFQECRQSDAMRRVLAVYGRGQHDMHSNS